ncbi:hypothetical protein P3C22_15935 [Pseudomonas sp. ER28]|uniref:hypothetical protein n=1 Tax=unclassified Pseudomonas TaxID=196821 RepID=UPI0023DFC260|nr:hypothetical protein [Pseudomonas sp. ER28]MDF3173520.1 hypothetical protein [Pseudomonas sp. ER28]
MTSEETAAAKKLELRNGLMIAVTTSLLTLAGVMSTGITGWITSSQSSAVTKSQACIKRLDAQEQNLRGKADQFLSALGNFTALTGHKPWVMETYTARLDALMQSGYSFSAYAPENLAKLSRIQVTALKNSIHGEDEKEAKASLEDFYETNRKWNEEFQTFLKQLESERSRC